MRDSAPPKLSRAEAQIHEMFPSSCTWPSLFVTQPWSPVPEQYTICYSVTVTTLHVSTDTTEIQMTEDEIPRDPAQRNGFPSSSKAISKLSYALDPAKMISKIQLQGGMGSSKWLKVGKVRDLDSKCGRWLKLLVQRRIHFKKDFPLPVWTDACDESSLLYLIVKTIG